MLVKGQRALWLLNLMEPASHALLTPAFSSAAFPQTCCPLVQGLQQPQPLGPPAIFPGGQEVPALSNLPLMVTEATNKSRLNLQVLLYVHSQNREISKYSCLGFRLHPKACLSTLLPCDPQTSIRRKQLWVRKLLCSRSVTPNRMKEQR